MKQIQITPAELRSQAAEMASLRTEYENLFSNVTSVLHATNAAWSENLSHNFVGKITSTQKSCSSILATLQWGSDAAVKSAESFESIDSALAGGLVNISKPDGSTVPGSDGGGFRTGNTEETKASWWDKLKNAVRGEADKISTGIAKKVDDVKKTVSAIVEGYKNKGVPWKIVKTGSAIIASIGAVMSTLAAWGVTAGSAGLATPLAAVVTTYGVNTLASSFSDIYNCWFGDVEKVGDVNVLKSASKSVLGESLGTLVYNAGALTATIASISALVGKVKQAPDMAKAFKEAAANHEYKMAFDGSKGLLGDILSGKMSLSALPLQVSLLNSQLKNIGDLSKCIGILSTVGTTTKKIADGVAEGIIKAVDPNLTYESSIIKNIFGEDSFAGKVESAVDEVKNITSAFEKDQYKDVGDGIKGNRLRTAQ